MKEMLETLIQDFFDKYAFKPNLLFVNPENLAQLREDLELSLTDDLRYYKGLKIIVLQNITKPEMIYL